MDSKMDQKIEGCDHYKSHTNIIFWVPEGFPNTLWPRR